MVFLGKIEENKFCGFSLDSLMGSFCDASFWKQKLCVKRSHKPLFMGIFKNVPFFKDSRDDKCVLITISEDF